MKYIVLDKDDIDKRIDSLIAKIDYANENPLTGGLYSIETWEKELDTLTKVVNASKDLEPILEAAFNEGVETAKSYAHTELAPYNLGDEDAYQAAFYNAEIEKDKVAYLQNFKPPA